MEFVCWKCGAPIEDEPLPLQRLAECRSCGAELHVCRMCEFYDMRVAKSCREPIADEVKEKERANFCDYFGPAKDAYTPPDTTEARAAMTKLEAIFGKPPEKGGTGLGKTVTEADKTRARLEQLFGSGPKDD